MADQSRETDEQDELEAASAPSKSARKREMLARQALGEALVALSSRELAAMPLEDGPLLQAIQEARTMRSHSALRRHRQYIGKLMRQIDPAPLQAALDELHQRDRAQATAFHALEALRDALLRDGDAALGEVLERFPQADRQQLRQLTRQARHDAKQERNSGASRRLFRYLRELQEESEASQGPA